MDPLGLAVVFVVLLLAVAVISAPLRRGSVEAVTTREEARREELVAARDAKYREIRDAEMDFRTSKLSEADWREIDRVLRGEAVEILRGLDELEA